ncbi:hypothetical protein JRI60_23065 [Archangium violaceum]|uniref:hypothetical protein n=1 Tax=Archangium violaceum TaxID=83451 RepID=UPI001951FAA4|nr:hypothetical protein [Archangium violaceum]QRO01695.1 hypothetical protein JRI60_23065 [Archangium violaceum]
MRKPAHVGEPSASKPLELVTIPTPPSESRVRRDARFAAPGEKRNRYHLPESLESPSPIGYRTRVSLSREEAGTLLSLLSLPRPARFVPGPALTERELFEESSLGVLSARQSTNYRGQREVLLGPADSERAASLLKRIGRGEAPVLDGAAYTHVVLARPYRTPFTFLLTFVGHRPLTSLVTVPLRAWAKRFRHADDIPTIGYLKELHLGVLADAMERATVIASAGTRRAQVFLEPFDLPADAAALRELEALVGLTAVERAAGWRISLVAQVGYVPEQERVPMTRTTARRLGAALLALRSERIQPGVNAEPSAPTAYQARQPMDVPEELTVQAGRAAYNAFAQFTGLSRERAKELVLLERIDVLTPHGKERLRMVREELEQVTDKIIARLPLWADLALGRALSRNSARGRKAFAMAGQRIYVGGLSRREVERAGLSFAHAVRAFGAGAARSALVAEVAGSTEIPEGCDLLGGICLMAGPVNQNDIGKQFFGIKDLLEHAFAGREPTSLLVWTLKAKTVADPIGNEQQLLDPRRKGALVDLRPGPHEVVAVRRGTRLEPLRQRGGRVNTERAFGDVGNFVTDPEGREIPGNRGAVWDADLGDAAVWPPPGH